MRRGDGREKRGEGRGEEGKKKGGEEEGRKKGGKKKGRGSKNSKREGRGVRSSSEWQKTVVCTLKGKLGYSPTLRMFSFLASHLKQEWVAQFDTLVHCSAEPEHSGEEIHSHITATHRHSQHSPSLTLTHT